MALVAAELRAFYWPELIAVVSAFGCTKFNAQRGSLRDGLAQLDAVGVAIDQCCSQRAAFDESFRL